MVDIDQKAVKKQLMAEGFALKCPPIGGAMYVKGDDYRDANGKACAAPKLDVIGGAEVALNAALEHVKVLSLGEQMQLAMGAKINHELMCMVMVDSSAGDVLKGYKDTAIRSYLTDQGVEVKKDAKTPALLQLVETLHA